MLQRFIAYLVFFVLMTFSIVGSLLIVVFLYLPFVALKAIVLAVAGRVRLRAIDTDADPETKTP